MRAKSRAQRQTKKRRSRTSMARCKQTDGRCRTATTRGRDGAIGFQRATIVFHSSESVCQGKEVDRRMQKDGRIKGTCSFHESKRRFQRATSKGRGPVISSSGAPVQVRQCICSRSAGADGGLGLHHLHDRAATDHEELRPPLDRVHFDSSHRQDGEGQRHDLASPPSRRWA
jgi:hypothetical protein